MCLERKLQSIGQKMRNENCWTIEWTPPLSIEAERSVHQTKIKSMRVVFWSYLMSDKLIICDYQWSVELIQRQQQIKPQELNANETNLMESETLKFQAAFLCLSPSAFRIFWLCYAMLCELARTPCFFFFISGYLFTFWPFCLHTQNIKNYINKREDE